jgi:hypothetical protein
MLTETARADCFKRLSARADVEESGLGEWRLRHTEETGSVTAERHGQCLYIIAGRQIVTAERLEVLALGFEGLVPDGEPIRQVIDRVRSAAAVAVIPWGFGKWWGRRGKVVSGLLKDHERLGFFLGDNGGRTAFLGRPAHFEDAVLDDDVAFLVEPDASGMAEGILQALTSRSERERRGTNAKGRYERDYSRPAYVAKMRRLMDLLR